MVKLIQYQIKLIALWSAFLLALLFHTQLALMPLFHGLSIASSHTHEHLPLNNIFWLMLVFFLVPLFMIAVSPFLYFRKGQWFNFGITVLYSLLNIAHLGLDIVVKAPSYQLFLMGVICLIGGALNGVTYSWIQQHSGARDKMLAS